MKVVIFLQNTCSLRFYILWLHTCWKAIQTVGADDIKPLLDLQVPIVVFAKRLGISRSTSYNEMKAFGLEPPKYPGVATEDLTCHILSIKKDHLNCGEKIVWGYRGLHVQRAWVREIIL